MVSRIGVRIVIFLPGFRDLATLPHSCSKSVQRCEAYIKTIVELCQRECYLFLVIRGSVEKSGVIHL
jgi:hypothetical protein